MIIDLSPGGKMYAESQNPLSERYANIMLDELITAHYNVVSAISAPKVSVPFLIETDWANSKVPYGYAQIHDFKNSLLMHGGNVYIRQLKTYISNEQTRGFFKKHIGRPYKRLRALNELLFAINQSNKVENSETIFCSELATLFYKEVGVIEHDSILSNNVIPAMFSSEAGTSDILSNSALPDTPLKISIAISEDDVVANACCKSLLKKIFECCFW